MIDVLTGEIGKERRAGRACVQFEANGWVCIIKKARAGKNVEENVIDRLSKS